MEASSGESTPPGPGEDRLGPVAARLNELAAELESDPDEERAAALVREASELAARAGEEVASALRSASGARDA